jgi:hypothetical protein
MWTCPASNPNPTPKERVTMDELEDTWSGRELPLLREAARRLEGGETNLYVDALAAHLNIDPAQAQAQIAVAALSDDGYLDGMRVAEIRGPIVITHISAKARRELGLWPSAEAGADRLMASLDALIAQAESDDRSRLEKVRDGLMGAGRDLVVSVAAAVITGQVPGQR